MGSPLAWSETFAIGHPALDADHRRLIDAINEICLAARGKAENRRLAPLLAAFRLASVEHFTRENEVLQSLGKVPRQDGRPDSPLLQGHLKTMSGTALDEHIAEHAASLATLDGIVRAPRAGAAPARPSLCVDLKGWFLDHAIKYDAHLKAIFQSM